MMMMMISRVRIRFGTNRNNTANRNVKKGKYTRLYCCSKTLNKQGENIISTDFPVNPIHLHFRSWNTFSTIVEKNVHIFHVSDNKEEKKHQD